MEKTVLKDICENIFSEKKLKKDTINEYFVFLMNEKEGLKRQLLSEVPTLGISLKNDIELIISFIKIKFFGTKKDQKVGNYGFTQYSHRDYSSDIYSLMISFYIGDILIKKYGQVEWAPENKSRFDGYKTPVLVGFINEKDTNYSNTLATNTARFITQIASTNNSQALKEEEQLFIRGILYLDHLLQPNFKLGVYDFYTIENYEIN